MPFYDYKCEKCGVFEVQQSMSDEKFTQCPQCGGKNLERLISLIGAVIFGGKEVNQYTDCIGAKTWRDKNGNLHKITSADGSSKSPTTTSKQYRSKEQVEAMKTRDNYIRQQNRREISYRRDLARMRMQQKRGK